jgi:hypothetical protein
VLWTLFLVFYTGSLLALYLTLLADNSYHTWVGLFAVCCCCVLCGAMWLR